MKTHKVCNLCIRHFYKPSHTHTRNNVIKIVILLLNLFVPTIENYDLLSNIDNLNDHFISSKNPGDTCGYCGNSSS